MLHSRRAVHRWRLCCTHVDCIASSNPVSFHLSCGLTSVSCGCRGYQWRRLVDTGLEAPQDAILDEEGAALEGQASAQPRMSACCLRLAESSLSAALTTPLHGQVHMLD